jgi:glucose/arabinose dehydrogenase
MTSHVIPPARPRRSRFVPRLEALEDRSVPSTLQADATPPVHQVFVRGLPTSATTTLPAGFAESTYASGFGQPTSMTFAPDGRLFITEKAGDIRVVQNGRLLPTPFLHLNVNTDDERGIESMALDPNFATNGFFYVFYSTPDPNVHNRVSRFQVSATNPNVADPASETVMLDGISSTSDEHNGGALHFGNDGMLYVSTGDGGKKQSAQKLGSLNGKILRLNVDAYPNVIPPDNPFVHRKGARPEIWALGFRNPFTFATIPGSNALFVNDVGGNKVEEVDLVLPGKNYGWPRFEGPGHTRGFTDPLYSYHHPSGHFPPGLPVSAVTGAVYNAGTGLGSQFQGAYFFSDFPQAFIKALVPAGSRNAVPFATGAGTPIDLAIGPDGALYYLSLQDAAVYRIGQTGS